MLIWRITSAAIGILYLILAFYIGGWFLNLSILFVSLIGMYEFYTAVRNGGYNPVPWVGYLFILFLFCFIALYPDDHHYMLLSALLATFFCLFLTVISPRLNLIDACLTVLGFIYPGMALMTLMLLHNAGTYGRYLLIFTLFATWATDTFAYFTGLALGKNKLCPRISPKKTIEGSIGGVAGSLVIGILVGMALTHFYKVEIGYHHYAILSLMCGVTSQMGDLSASRIKRFCNIKDFGRIMPGHGGILDRFDSIIFTVPVVYSYYLLFLH